LMQVAGCLRFFEARDEVGERAVVDAATILCGSDREADRKMGFADARRSEQDDVLPALEEAEFVERLDLLSLDRRLKCEVEVLEGLDDRQPAAAHGGLQAAVVAEGDLGAEQLLDRLSCGQRATIDA